jgi:hypothetical protein
VGLQSQRLTTGKIIVKEVTHIGFNVQVLQVKCVLPDVYTDDGNMSKKGVLVRSRDNLEQFRSRIEALMRG